MSLSAESFASEPELANSTCSCPSGRSLRELCRQLHRPGIGRLEEVIVIGKRLQRLVAGFGQFAIAVAHLHAPKSRHAVDDAVAFGIPEIDAVGPA